MKYLKQYISKLGVELIENVNMRKIEKKSNYLEGWPTNKNEIIKGDFFVTTVGAWGSEINDEYKNKSCAIRVQIIR